MSVHNMYLSAWLFILAPVIVNICLSGCLLAAFMYVFQFHMQQSVFLSLSFYFLHVSLSPRLLVCQYVHLVVDSGSDLHRHYHCFVCHCVYLFVQLSSGCFHVCVSVSCVAVSASGHSIFQVIKLGQILLIFLSLSFYLVHVSLSPHLYVCQYVHLV